MINLLNFVMGIRTQTVVTFLRAKFMTVNGKMWSSFITFIVKVNTCFSLVIFSTGTWLSLVSIDIKTKELAILEKFLLILVQIRANKS